MIRPHTCPICGKPVPPATDPTGGTAPFCSLRCKQIDLFRWADGRYAIVEPLRLSDSDDFRDEATDNEPLSEE